MIPASGDVATISYGLMQVREVAHMMIPSVIVFDCSSEYIKYISMNGT